MDLVTVKKTKLFLREASRLKLLQDSNQSSREMINIFVKLLDHGKLNDTTNAATFRPRLRSPAVFPNFRGNML